MLLQFLQFYFTFILPNMKMQYKIIILFFLEPNDESPANVDASVNLLKIFRKIYS